MMVSDRTKRVIEVLVASHVLLGFLIVPIGYFWFREQRLGEYFRLFERDYPVFPIMGCSAGCVLLVWALIADGANSGLWRWLPPFALLPIRDKELRLLVIIACAAVTLVGSMGTLFGLIPGSR